MKMAIVALLLGLALIAVGCTQGGQYSPPGQPTQQAAQPQAGTQGRTVFSVTDAAADMGAVTSVKVTVGLLEVHSATQGWMTVSTAPKTYDLLQLKASGAESLLADASLKSGSYDQIRMEISNVLVADSGGEHQAKLPSSELRIVGGFEVAANSTTAVKLDFVADRSLHVTGSGKYILAPVVRVQEKSDAQVEVRNDGEVRTSGGRVRSETEVGMDADGKVGFGLGIPADVEISENSGIIKIGGKLGIGRDESENKSANESARENATIDINARIRAGLG